MSEELIKNLRIKAGMIENCEKIAWGSETKLMREAADALEHQQKVIDQVRVVDKTEPPVSKEDARQKLDGYERGKANGSVDTWFMLNQGLLLEMLEHFAGVE